MAWTFSGSNRITVLFCPPGVRATVPNHAFCRIVRMNHHVLWQPPESSCCAARDVQLNRWETPPSYLQWSKPHDSAPIKTCIMRQPAVATRTCSSAALTSPKLLDYTLPEAQRSVLQQLLDRSRKLLDGHLAQLVRHLGLRARRVFALQGQNPFGSSHDHLLHVSSTTPQLASSTTPLLTGSSATSHTQNPIVLDHYCVQPGHVCTRLAVCSRLHASGRSGTIVRESRVSAAISDFENAGAERLKWVICNLGKHMHICTFAHLHASAK